MHILISSARQAQWRQDGSCIFPIGLTWKPVSPSCSSSGPLTWVNKVVPDSRTFLFLGHLCTSLELSVAWRHTCHLEKQVSACHLHASQLKVMLQPYSAFFPLNILAFINNITFSTISRISVSDSNLKFVGQVVILCSYFNFLLGTVHIIVSLQNQNNILPAVQEKWNTSFVLMCKCVAYKGFLQTPRVDCRF